MRPLTLLPVLLLACELPTEPAAIISVPQEAFEEVRPPSSRGSPVTLGAMAVGDAVVIHSHARGCFHDEIAELRLIRTAAGFEAEARTAPNGEPLPAVKTATLTAEEVASLDLELTIERADGAKGWCTSQVEHRIEVNGEEREIVFDGSCSLSPFHDEGRALPEITIGQVVWRITDPAGYAAAMSGRAEGD